MKNFIKKLSEKNKFFSILIHLCFRLYSLLFKLVFLIMCIFPIKSNKIVGSNMKGKRYGDNPKYIFDSLAAKDPSLELVWLLNDTDNKDVPSNVRIARNSYFSQIYELATAKVWIDSNAKQYGFHKRKGQIYIQTWHGSYGLKKIGKDLPNPNPMDMDNLLYNFKYVDLLVSNSKKTTSIYKNAFDYNGEVIECGSPRNDIFFKNAETYTDKVKKAFNVEGKHIALYAPTYRRNFSLGAYDINFEDLKQSLADRFGGEWVVLIRLHPYNLAEAKSYITYSDTVLNASDYDVMQELLVASEVLITDYSSCMFDFVTTGKTCFLYANDLEEYKKDRDCYFEIDELPFPLAANNDELKSIICGFDQDKYDQELKNLFERVGLSESGEASDRVADYIIKAVHKG